MRLVSSYHQNPAHTTTRTIKGLQQVTEQKRAKQTVAEGKSMTSPSGEAKKAKSKESESQKAKDAVKCKDVD